MNSPRSAKMTHNSLIGEINLGIYTQIEGDWRSFVLYILFQIDTTFSTLLQLDGDNFLDFCGAGGGEFFLFYFPLEVEEVNFQNLDTRWNGHGMQFRANGCSTSSGQASFSIRC